jgi:hypothetical protein
MSRYNPSPPVGKGPGLRLTIDSDLECFSCGSGFSRERQAFAAKAAPTKLKLPQLQSFDVRINRLKLNGG